MKSRRFWLLASSSVLLATPAFAQETPPSSQPAAAQTDDTGRSGGLADIVVTARRTSENLQSTPVAVTAVSAETLASRGSADITALQDFVPNVTFNPTASNSGSSNAAVIFIRGIGQSDFYPQVDPGVGVYLDGVYISRSTGAVLDAVDVGQIEVLRGPQGTLYGKNTIGGAINITSRAPEKEFGGYIEATTGRFNRIDGKIRLDVPISDRLLTSFSFATLNRDGYYRVLGLDGKDTGHRLGDVSALTARFAATYEASNSLDLSFSADWTRRREESAGSTLLKINPNGLGPTVFNTVIAPTLVPTLGPRAFYNDQYITGDFYSTYGDFNRSKSNLDVWGLGLTANWKVADWLSIKSITAYRTSKSDNDRDGDGSPLVILGPATLIDQKQFSQELQFSGETANRRFKWIAGLYYLRESIDFVAPVNISFVDTDNRAIIENRSYAAFGQASFSVTDRLRVTGGLRYTRDKKRNAPTIIATRLIDPATLTPVPPQALPIPFLISDESRTDSKVTPAATIDYKFSDDVFGYFTYSQGFKSGGFSQRIAFPRQKAPSFDPETVKSYEAGLKLELLDRRLRLNTAAFYTDYSNLQVIIFNNVEPQTQNGGAATLKGVEFEMQSRPVDGLSVNFSAGYLDAKYDSINPGTLIPANAKLAYTPEWTLSGSIAYEAQTSIGTITPRLDWSYRSAVRFDALNTPELVQPGYHLLNANLTYVDPSEKWRVALGVTNLTNRHYLVGGFSDLPATGFVDGTYARPREWYLTVRRNF